MATKVTATQRKHGLQSLVNLHVRKTEAIRKEFADKPENKLRTIPMQVQPSMGEAMKAIMGMDSTVSLKNSREEIIRGMDSHRGSFFSINPLHYVNPLNHVEIAEAMAYNDQINQRHREHVDGRLSLLRSAYTRACDIVALAESGDDVLHAIRSFENQEF